MKAYVKPVPETLSKAMWRVSDALKIYAPPSIQIVDRVQDAELQVIHVISPSSMEGQVAPKRAVMQYCLNSASGILSYWQKQWSDSLAVWSYYALDTDCQFMHAPLGVDGHSFRSLGLPRDLGIVTSGYVAGPGAEAIEEPAIAAATLSLHTAHIGPHDVVNKRQTPMWTAHHGISDNDLCRIYNRSLWVSGMRHIEGFELPVIEGLACGARPIVFDRPESRQWFDGHAVFVEEQSGDSLVEELIDIMHRSPVPVSDAERIAVLRRFSWETLVRRFWSMVLA